MNPGVFSDPTLTHTFVLVNAKCLKFFLLNLMLDLYK